MTLSRSPSNLIPSVPFASAIFTGLGNTPTRILPGDGQRAGIVFSADLTNSNVLPGEIYRTVSVWPSPSFLPGEGFQLTIESPTLKLTFAEFGSMINADWWALCNCNTAGISVASFQYKPRNLGALLRVR